MPDYPTSREPAGAYGWKPMTGAAGEFFGLKNGGKVPFWDEFDLDFVRKAERAETVLRYSARPLCLLDTLSFQYVPSFEVSTTIGFMVVEISERGMPTSKDQANRAAELKKQFAAAGIMFAQFSTYEVSRRKIFARSRALRKQPNDDGSQARRARVNAFFASLGGPLDR